MRCLESSDPRYVKLISTVEICHNNGFVVFAVVDDVRNIYIYIFIHHQLHQDGSTVYIRRLNKIYNLTKKTTNAYAMKYTNRLA